MSRGNLLKFGLALVGLGNPFLLHAQSPPACLAYEPSVVQLTGTIVRRTFPGPPNYTSVKQGDRPETAWLLILRQPICVQAVKDDSGMYPAEADIHEIQFSFADPDGFKRYSDLVGTGKTVVVTGTLFGAHTGHHHTPVLMVVKTLSKPN